MKLLYYKRTARKPLSTIKYLPADSLLYFEITPNVFTVPRNTFPPGSDLAFSGASGISFSKTTGSAIIYMGSYKGDGTASHSIATIPFTPMVVWVMGTVAGVEKGAIKIRGMATNRSHPWKNNPAATDPARDNRVLTLDPSGFTVGTDLNSNGDTFFFIAFPEVAGATSVGSYTGTGSLVTTTLPFVPDFVMLLADDSTTVGGVGAPTPTQFLPGIGVGDFALGAGFNQNFQGDSLSPSNASVIGSTMQGQNAGGGFGGYSVLGVVYRWFAIKADETKISGLQKLDYTGNGISPRNIEPPLDFIPTFWMDFAASTSTAWKDVNSGLQSGTLISRFADGLANQDQGITILNDGFSVGGILPWNGNGTLYRAFMARTVTGFDLKFGGAAEYSYFNGLVTKYFHEAIGGLLVAGTGNESVVLVKAATFIVEGVVDQGTISAYGPLKVILMQNYFPYNDPPRVPIRTMKFWVSPAMAATFSGGQLWNAVFTPRTTEAAPTDPLTMDYTVLESDTTPYNTLPGLAAGSHTPPIAVLGSYNAIRTPGVGVIPRLITLLLGQSDRLGAISDYPLGAIWRVTLFGPM